LLRTQTTNTLPISCSELSICHYPSK
jgi:hypothetical protein